MNNFFVLLFGGGGFQVTSNQKCYALNKISYNYFDIDFLIFLGVYSGQNATDCYRDSPSIEHDAL